MEGNYDTHLIDTCSYSSMAQKESSHRETVDGLNTELTQIRRQLEELTVLSRDQVCFALASCNAIDDDWLYRPSTCPLSSKLFVLSTMNK